MHEKGQVLHILNLLRDVVAPLSDKAVARLSPLMTLILAHALRGVFYPANFVYPISIRFLLQRPALDPSDVPVLYDMLYSNSNVWKKERIWIIGFLEDGLLESMGWRTLKRRHTWDLLASMFQDSQDHALRHPVLKVSIQVCFT